LTEGHPKTASRSTGGTGALCCHPLRRHTQLHGAASRDRVPRAAAAATDHGAMPLLPRFRLDGGAIGGT